MATRQDSVLWPGDRGGLRAGGGWRSCPASGARTCCSRSACFVAFVLPGLPASRLLVLESRLALPGIAIVMVACELAARASWPIRAGRAAAAAVLAALAAATFSYAGDFRDRLSFAEAAVRGSPHSALAHRNLGVTYHLAGQTAAARREYQAAAAEDPR